MFIEKSYRESLHQNQVHPFVLGTAKKAGQILVRTSQHAKTGFQPDIMAMSGGLNLRRPFNGLRNRPPATFLRERQFVSKLRQKMESVSLQNW
jgi:hypothetical protein